MTTEYLYPLDLTGTQPSNRIKNEKHTVSPPSQITQASFIVLRACPFFADNIVIKDGITATARTLAFGEDYILTHKSIALTMLTKKPVYASIMFKDRNYTGSVYVTYNTVGGEYNLPDYTIVEKLTRQKYVLTHTSFDQIVGLPAAYPNPPHQHDPTDLVGMSTVVDKMAEIAAAIRSTQGSYGLLNTVVNGHINSAVAHTSAQVGLGNVKNYDIAVDSDFPLRAADKYATAVTVYDHVSGELSKVATTNAATYLTKTEANLLYIKGASVYSKAESDNLYFNKSYLNLNFLKKTEAITIAQVGTIVNNIVDLSQYHTRTEAYGTFYSRVDADARYYTRTQVDSTFVTQTGGDNRYIQTTNPEAILSPKVDNTLTIEGGKFYVGKDAPDNVNDLYIDCINGSDNSPGTRAAPLRTLKKAASMTPENKSSTWRLRHYSIDQMSNANYWYYWDFDHTVRNGAKRIITVYSNTWIDGAKNSQARQLGDGRITWEFASQVTRVPVYVRSFTAAATNTQSIYSAILADDSEIEIHGLQIIKPKPIDPQYIISDGFNSSAFFYGKGQVSFIGTWLTQMGLFKSEDSTFFKWSTSHPNQEIKMLFDGCSYGYCTEIIETGITKYKYDLISVFGYEDSLQRPFQYSNTIGSIVASPGDTLGAGAVAAGATLVTRNLQVILQRPKMFRGLNFVNGVCTNIVTNLTLVE